MRHAAISLLVRSERGPETCCDLTLRTRTLREPGQLRRSFSALLPRALALASGWPSRQSCVVSTRKVSSERSRLAPASAALGCMPRGQWAPLDARLVEPPELSRACAVLGRARPAPSPRSPLATVRRRGLVVGSCLRCSSCSFCRRHL